VITNHPIGGRCCWARRPRMDLRDAHSRRPIGNTPASKPSGLTTFASMRNATSRPITSCLPHDDCGLLERAADPSPPLRHRPTTASSRTRPGSAPAESRDDHGRRLTVPYIVRVEARHDQSRHLRLAVLFDPAQAWTPLDPQAQWNGKVVYTFGASTGQPRLQFRTEQNWADDAALFARLHGRR